MVQILNKQEFSDKLLELNLTIDSFSKQANTSIEDINKWNKEIPINTVKWLLDYEYKQKIKLLQKEFIEIKKSSSKWFKNYHHAIFDFVMSKEKYTEFTVEDYNIIIRVGNEHFGFKHLVLKHYGKNSIGEITALDILKIGNIIKYDVTVPTENEDRIVFMQSKNNIKYKVVLNKEKNGKLLFSFFSDK